MPGKKKILAISGSTRIRSLNSILIHAVAELSKDILEIKVFEDLTGIPHFNPDLDNENPPLQVIAFRKQLQENNGILICTPEYAMGVPGTLKNAIDWTVSSCEFSHKPVALITASTSGEKAHVSLLETLGILEAKITADTSLRISYAKTKINIDSVITDGPTRIQVSNLIKAFEIILNEN